MPAAVSPIPKGFHSVTPYLTLDNAAHAIDFYKRAFGAKETVRMNGPGGKVAHAEIQIGDSIVMLGDEGPGSGKSPKSLGGTSGGIMLYVQDADAVFKQAIQAGAKADSPMADMFWGDRYGKLTDPFGVSWSIATHKEDVEPAEMKKRMDEFVAKMGPPHTKAAG